MKKLLFGFLIISDHQLSSHVVTQGPPRVCPKFRRPFPVVHRLERALNGAHSEESLVDTAAFHVWLVRARLSCGKFLLRCRVDAQKEFGSRFLSNGAA